MCVSGILTQEYARVNLDNEACSASSVAYLKAEHLTARLMALTGVPSIVNGKSLQQAFPEVFTPTDRGPAPGTAPANKKPRADEKPAAAAWKAGTGYGSGSTSKQDAIWDAKRAEAVQASRDAEACAVLESLAFEVREGLAAPPGAPGRGALLYVIRSGCLVQLLVRELSKAGFQDMTARVPYYSALFQCVEALTAQDTSALLEWHAEGDSNTVAAAVARLNSQAANFLRVVAQAGDDGAEGDRMHRTLPLPEDPKELSALFSGGKQAQAEVDVALAKYVVRVAAAVGAAAPGASGSRPPAAGAAGRLTRSQAAAAAAAGPSGSAGGENVDGRYVSVMAPFRVRMLANVAANHAFNADSEREATAPTKVRARRVASELASLESDLPVTTSSSVFVVADESKSVLWKAMITGPEDTPYAGGMFLFDIYFPAEYPSIAPKVRLRTTGGGSVRFNPNLYNEGKVCLSLLGTWSGGKGETWQADVSTILQVLLSIQSLIFVPEPYYNEPG